MNIKTKDRISNFIENTDNIIVYPFIWSKFWYYFYLRSYKFYHQYLSNIDDVTNKKKVKYNPKWPYIPDHPCRMLTTGDPASRKENVLLSLINN